jgi:threonyl-tRNA synthetase
MVEITLPDKSTREFEAKTTAYDVAASISERLAQQAYGARIDGEVRDISWPIDGDAEVEIITFKSDEAASLELIRHSCAHVMAEAICKLYPQTQLVYGPPVDNGFYYDIDLDHPLSTEDFEKIEAEMAKIIKEDRPFVRYELGREDAIPRLEEEGNQYKIDNAERADGDVISFYVTGQPDQGHFEDLCRGPHVPSTRFIKAFKVMSVAGAYYRGDASKQQLQRVYGTAFADKKALKAYLNQLEEAKKRDHRVLGQQLELFHIDEAVGQGLVLWKPNGAVIRQELQNFISEELTRQGYHHVFTPHIGKLGLYKTSGHFPYYQESQYPPLIDHDHMAALADENCGCADLASQMKEGVIEGYLLKPMNCPHHIKIFASEQHSYRDLPIRLAEFGTVYRWEQSGEISGMTRVRGFTQDDAHLFCTEDQIAEELLGCLDLVKTTFSTLGMTDYRVRVGLRDPDGDKYVGDAEKWDKAELACRQAAETLGVPFTEETGEAAFYGPKIDFVVKDVVGREWQLGTVQVDYNLPERFNLHYTGQDNQQLRPVMIHRAPFGSMERFVGVLIEHYAGAFPLWLAPEQVRIMPISEKTNDYAKSVYNTLKNKGLRCTVDLADDKINGKIKRAHGMKIPYMLVTGPAEAEENCVTVRIRGQNEQEKLSLDDFIAGVEDNIARRDFCLAWTKKD